MAVETDYNALVFRLSDLAEELVKLKLEVEGRLLTEKREGLEPNETHSLGQPDRAEMALPTGGLTEALGRMAGMVLQSRPGEAVFTDQPPSAPDAPP